MKKLIKEPMKLSGVTLAFGITGKVFSSPGLTAAGQATSKFISPAVNISVGGNLIKKLKELKGGLKK